jgi:hypothetical protein
LGRDDQAAIALVDLGGTSGEIDLLRKVLELFGDQPWNHTEAAFHVALASHAAQMEGRYYVLIAPGVYEVTRRGRAKARVDETRGSAA